MFVGELCAVMSFTVTHLRLYRRSLLVARAAFCSASDSPARALTTETMAPQLKNRVFVVGVGMTKVNTRLKFAIFARKISSGPSLKFCL